MKTCGPFRSASAAFTVVELLIVIAIIAVVVGLLFPAITTEPGCKKSPAKNDVMQIVTAVKAYHTEYGKYPSVDAGGGSGGGESDVIVGDPKGGASISNNALFDTLRSIPNGPNAGHRLNPRKIVFFEGRSVKNPSEPRSGFMDTAGNGDKGAFYDQWGKQYCVILDLSRDNILDVNKAYADFAGDHRPRTGVGAFSMGKDTEVGDKKEFAGWYRQGTRISDDVISWQ
ncbi:MAG: prepilin-type cleavage/methylation domain-containing protein [Verrucomicrobiota bacterium]|nr:prepilin-type cleavage/methylation domain-containing protein [Verrucomicrobiota bacterium]